MARFSQFRLGRSRLVQAGLLALVVTISAVLATPAPGMANGANFHYHCTESWTSCQVGVEVSGPAGLPCGTEEFSVTTVCIRYDGDIVYVRDGDVDGDSALAMIQSSSGDVTYRLCRNQLGAGKWARCNFDWSESATKYVSGGVLSGYYDMSGNNLWEFRNN